MTTDEILTLCGNNRYTHKQRIALLVLRLVPKWFTVAELQERIDPTRDVADLQRNINELFDAGALERRVRDAAGKKTREYRFKGAA
jgi:predicted transcriptional regulator